MQSLSMSVDHLFQLCFPDFVFVMIWSIDLELAVQLYYVKLQIKSEFIKYYAKDDEEINSKLGFITYVLIRFTQTNMKY